MPVQSKLAKMPKRTLISLLEDIYTFLDGQELVVHALMTDWQDDVPPHVRVRVQVRIYEPLLSKMLELGLRPISRERAITELENPPE